MWIINKEETHMIDAHDIYVVFGYSEKDLKKLNDKSLEINRNLTDRRLMLFPSTEKIKEETLKWAKENGIKEKMFLYVNGELFEERELTRNTPRTVPFELIERAMNDGKTLS